MGEAPEPEKEEPEAPARAAEPEAPEAERAPEPEPPGDPKKEWPLALAIMLFIALMSWAFLTMFKP